MTATPFANAEECFFWFAQAADNGGRPPLVPARPCGVWEVYRAIDQLYRRRLLARDDMAVLAYYGRRLIPPAGDRPREARAVAIWKSAFRLIEPEFRRRGWLASTVEFTSRTA